MGGPNENPFHLVERHFLGAAVVSRVARVEAWFAIWRGLFERTAVLQISGDARGAKDVVANSRGDASGFGATLNHHIGVGLGSGLPVSWPVARL